MTDSEKKPEFRTFNEGVMYEFNLSLMEALKFACDLREAHAVDPERRAEDGGLLK